MSFRPLELQHLITFNSDTSCKFLQKYENFVDEKLQEENSKPKSQSFAPSSIRCKRLSWFRLRGVQPDIQQNPNRSLAFTADIGTACHRIIQSNLQELFGEDWINVEEYLKEYNPKYEYSVQSNGPETLVNITKPPVKFACDGIIRLNGIYYLLEIKTSEFSSFDKLTDIKPQHYDQVKCYSTLLGLSHVLVLYEDRQYGNQKCFEYTIKDSEMQEIWDMFDYVQKMVEANLAPPKLPSGDYWCTMCNYSNKCKEWG